MYCSHNTKLWFSPLFSTVSTVLLFSTVPLFFAALTVTPPPHPLCSQSKDNVHTIQRFDSVPCRWQDCHQWWQHRCFCFPLSQALSLVHLFVFSFWVAISPLFYLFVFSFWIWVSSQTLKVVTTVFLVCCNDSYSSSAQCEPACKRSNFYVYKMYVAKTWNPKDWAYQVVKCKSYHLTRPSPSSSQVSSWRLMRQREAPAGETMLGPGWPWPRDSAGFLAGGCLNFE